MYQNYLDSNSQKNLTQQPRKKKVLEVALENWQDDYVDVSVAEAFSVEVPGLSKPLIGEFDLIVRNDAEETVCDWKTSASKWQTGKAKGNGFGYEIRDWSDVAGAIVCGGMGRERNLVVDKRQKNLTPTTHIKGKINKEGIRKMTPREWARLQGFPDSFVLPLADTHLYKQFGNSVTVNVIAAIAERIKEVLDNA